MQHISMQSVSVLDGLQYERLALDVLEGWQMYYTVDAGCNRLGADSAPLIVTLPGRGVSRNNALYLQGFACRFNATPLETLLVGH